MANKNNQKPATIPVYGSAKEIVGALHQMAKEKMPSSAPISSVPNQNPPNAAKQPPKTTTANQPQPPTASKKNYLNIVLILAVIIAAATITYLLINRSKLLVRLQQGAVYLPSETDMQTQEKIKGITGYNWQEFARSKHKGTTEEKLTALLLLYSEETTAFKLFPFVDRSVGINPEEVASAGLVPIDENITSENITALFENLDKLWQLYDKKGVDEAKIHQERLAILKEYFSKYEFLQKDQIPKETDAITASLHVAENQQDFLKLLLERFNIFKKSYAS